MARRINAPGIEINEIDRSGYDETVDNSVIGTATLVLGFADKGEDYNVKWMNTANTFLRTYGTPKTEAERYFYNSVFEVLNRGGVCYTAKLPYDNASLENYVYTSFTIDLSSTPLKSVSSIVNNIQYIKDDETDPKKKINSSFFRYLFYPLSSVIEAKEPEDGTYPLYALNDLMEYVELESNLTKEDIDILNERILSSEYRRRKTGHFISSLIFGNIIEDDSDVPNACWRLPNWEFFSSGNLSNTYDEYFVGNGD